MKIAGGLTLPGIRHERGRNQWGRIMLEVGLGIVGILTLVLLLGWIGLQIRPLSFPNFPQVAGTMQTIPLPENLPSPVARFYHTVYGDTIPVITSAVITGHADVRPAGPITFPARFRFTHLTGQGYRHYIEAGLFGLPMMQVDERYLDGHALGVTPFGVDEGDRVDQGANLGMWAETIWMPSVFLTDARVHWQAVNDNTAILVVPFNQGEDHFVVRFNPETGLIDWFESMRYHNQANATKVLWMNQALEWSKLNGVMTNTVGAAIWMDDGKPWAVFHVDDIRYNVDVNESIRAQGP
jgi:Family of unknown function (DUF6544)